MKQKNHTLLYFLSIAVVLIPFLLQDSYYQPHRDEYLYLAQGLHPAWGYMEVPPLLSLFAMITQSLGAGFFWIKIWPALSGGLLYLLLGKFILHKQGNYIALLFCWLPFGLGGWLRLHFLFQPNFLDVFFWTCMALTLMQYVETKRNYWLYLFGLAAGLGMMSKYSAAFYIISLLAGLAISRERKIFLNPHLYGAGLLALLIFLPNLVWQYQHRFPVIHHMQELEAEQLQFIAGSGFLKEQLMMNLANIFTWITGLYVALKARQGSAYRFIGWAYIAVILVLFFLHGKPYYALGAYPVLFALGALQLQKLAAGKTHLLLYVMGLFSLCISLFALPTVLPLAKPQWLITYFEKTGLDQTGGFTWEDRQKHPLPQDYADMIGWKEMTEKAAAVYHQLPPKEQAQTIIYCRGYFTAGALNYFGKAAGLPEVYSDNGSFLWWMPDSFPYKNLLLVAKHIPDRDDTVFNYFESRSIKDSVNQPLFRENDTKFILYENAADSMRYYTERSIATQKAAFKRLDH